MEVSSLLSASQSSAAAQTKKTGTLTQQEFMNLFVAQMQNQNPLEPMDNYQMASQMAQFSSIEALQTMTDSMKNLELYLGSMNSLQASSLVGRKIKVSGKTLEKSADGVSEAYYQLASAGKATIDIYDASGKLVRHIDVGKQDTSEKKVPWDGKDENGATVADGEYTFKVSAVDDRGQSVSVSTYTVGTLSGVSFEGGVSYLQVGSRKYTLSEIISILN